MKLRETAAWVLITNWLVGLMLGWLHYSFESSHYHGVARRQRAQQYLAMSLYGGLAGMACKFYYDALTEEITE